MTQTNAIEKLISRIDPAYGKYISCSEAWYPILANLEEQLNYLDPEYTIQQVKSKFAELRFYYETKKTGVVLDIMEACIGAATFEASRTCEDCGKSPWGDKDMYSGSVKLREGGWMRTLCDQCADIRPDTKIKFMIEAANEVRAQTPLEDILARQYMTAEAKEREEKYNA